MKVNQLFKAILLSCVLRIQAELHSPHILEKTYQMTLERFIQLWTHRYHKYSHIFKARLLGYQARSHFASVKRKLSKGQKLIAIIRTEHFGDIIAAEPISRHVRSIYPDAYIVWFVKPVFHELVDFNPAVNEVFQEFCVTQREVLLQGNVFDEVFQLQFRNNNHCDKCQVFIENPVAQQRHIDIFTYFNFGNLLEVFAKTAGLISEKAAFPSDDQPKLYLQDSHIQKADSLLLPDKFIVLHCRSNYAPKDWPADRWEQLIAWLTEKYNYQIIEVGSASNLNVNTKSYRNLCGQLSILETAEVIRRADYFIGLDSGPSHLGNATGTFGVILMGSLNNFPDYNPYSGGYGRQENAVFVRRKGSPCAELSFEFVREQVEIALGTTERKA
jgi:heptosyltransferase-3